MIRFVRGEAPPALRRHHDTHAPSVKTAWQEAVVRAERDKEHGWFHPVAPEHALPDLTGYQVAKEGLFRDQHTVCAWCGQRQREEDFRDVDHFRPKSIYPWLTWTWENLLFSCNPCNRQQKGKLFPLLTDVVLAVGQMPSEGLEEPALLDPFVDDPHQHITYQPEGLEGWRPVPVSGSRRGFATIVVLGLDREALMNDYRVHVRRLQRDRGALRRAVESRDDDALRSAWNVACELHLEAGEDYTALTRAVFAHDVPADLREKLNLTFPS